MKKTALWISLALTAFLLLVAGGIVTTVKSAQKVNDATTQATDPVVQQAAETPTQAIDPALQQAIKDRETAYQNMIAEANARLLQAQKDEQALHAQLQALQQSNNPAPDPQPTPLPVGITPQQAAQVAGSYIHRTDAYSVESVSTNGATAYKVTFSSGDVVYVSTAGQVISVNYAPRASASVPARQPSGEHDNESEHDGD
jgi:hypothetical protein